MFRKLIEQQIEIENIPFFKQMFQTDIIVFLQQVNITFLPVRATGCPMHRANEDVLNTVILTCWRNTIISV